MNNTNYKIIIIVLIAVIIILCFFIATLLAIQIIQPKEQVQDYENEQLENIQSNSTNKENTFPATKPEQENAQSSEAEKIIHDPIAGWINTTAVKIRSKQTTDSDLITIVCKAQEVLITDMVKGLDDDGFMWYAVEYKDYKGFIRENLISLEKTPELEKVEQLTNGTSVKDEIDGEYKNTHLVYVKDVAPNVLINLTLAQEDNFIGPRLYAKEVAMVQSSTGELLNKASKILEDQGYQIMLWDGYRPYSASVKMYEIINDPDLVADPKKGSKHNRGAAVDVTLCKDGVPVVMPTDHRYLDKKHSAIKSDMTPEERENYEILANAMTSVGFTTYKNEWWHFNNPKWEDYPVMDFSLDIF